MESIKKQSSNPLYQQISEYLEEKIKGGEYKVGTQIPTEIELMHKFDVSRITVRQAVKDLLEKDLIEKKQGKGTFVKNSKFYHKLENFKGLYETLIKGGVEPETELLEFNKVESSFEVANAIGIIKGDQVLRILRLYRIDGTPVALAQISLTPKVADLISREEAENHPLVELAAKKMGCRVGKVHFEIFSEIATKTVGKNLEINEGSAILGAERILYATDLEPIEHTLLWFRSDLYRFSIDLNGDPNVTLSEVSTFHSTKKHKE